MTNRAESHCGVVAAIVWQTDPRDIISVEDVTRIGKSVSLVSCMTDDFFGQIRSVRVLPTGIPNGIGDVGDGVICFGSTKGWVAPRPDHIGLPFGIGIASREIRIRWCDFRNKDPSDMHVHLLNVDGTTFTERSGTRHIQNTAQV